VQVRRKHAGVVQELELWRLPTALFYFRTHLHGVKKVVQSQEELATMLGVSETTVSRTLSIATLNEAAMEKAR
jgi:transcriptional regulator with XRE-family HTH domain